MRAEVAALHDGDPGPRLEAWSHGDPVTLFGAERTGWGWEQLEPIFQWLARSFDGSRSVDYDVLAAGASGDLGYVVAVERSVTSDASKAVSYALRVTTIFRREAGSWKIVHRHGDPYDEQARDALRRRAEH
jgi:ketosteroid isomerase-like protein